MGLRSERYADKGAHRLAERFSCFDKEFNCIGKVLFLSE